MQGVTGAMKDPTILVVDDTPTILDLVSSILTAEGFHTLVASDGRTACELSHVEQPDLILMDVLMPGETGFETCARLKSDPATADIPIIFLSSLDDVKSKVTGLKIGGVDYIAKPMHGEEVLARVRVHLRIRETNRALVAQQRARLEQLREAQQAILVRPEDCPEASFAVYYKPLEEAGGDFYDVVRLGTDIFGYFVADISGHGVSAAFLTSAVKALLRQYAGPMFSPEDTHARRRFGHGSDAGRGTIPDSVLRAPEPADASPLRNQRRASSADPGNAPGKRKPWNSIAIRWECSVPRFCSARTCVYRRATASSCTATVSSNRRPAAAAAKASSGWWMPAFAIARRPLAVDRLKRLSENFGPAMHDVKTICSCWPRR